MKKKIKNFFGFVGRAWSGGRRGKFGVLFAVLSIYTFIGLFLGDVSIQKFIMNIWHASNEQVQLAAEQNKLEMLNRHIELLQSYSPDYVDEMGLKKLNIGDPEFKVLKI